MAKKKQKKAKPSISKTKSDSSEQKPNSKETISDIADVSEVSVESSNSEVSKPEVNVEEPVIQTDSTGTDSAGEYEEPDEIIISDDTLSEIGTSDKDLTFKKVAGAYEEVKHKREQYKKIGPVVVLVTGIIFLALMFTLENKITFLILWVISVLYIAALMIRIEYKYHQFRYYLGLSEEETDAYEEPEAVGNTEDEKKSVSQSGDNKENESKNAEQEKTL